jgi:hypothetical protein
MRNVISLIGAVIIEGVIRDTHRVMSKFMHPIDEEGCEFMLNPRMVDAIYIFRQALGVVNYLVEP